MDTFLANIFVDETAEFAEIGRAVPGIDFTDWPLTPALVPPLTASGDFYVTSAISEHGYFEIQFMLGAGAFWGCNMNFGNSQCGLDIRQGISHLIDKTKFTTGETTINGVSSGIDNPLPTSDGLPSPTPCAWDNGGVPAALANTFTTAPVPGTMQEAGANCIVGSPGGTAYHLASASGIGTPWPWQPIVSDLDFCAAAAHFIDAGLATGVVTDSANPALRNCTLTGVNPAVMANPFGFFVRNDHIARLDLGDSLAQTICALFTGAYTTGCGTDAGHTNIVKVQHGAINAFSGFTTSKDHVDVSWEMYTAGYSNIFPFDSSLYHSYNSRFVSGISSIHQANGGTCSNDSVPTSSAGNYMYLCNTNYDSISNQMEFANCLTAEVGTDPQAGRALTFGSCTAANGGGWSAISAGYQTEDAFGKGAFTIPVFQQTDQFGYLACSPAARPCNSAAGMAAQWHRAINDFGSGLPNFFTWINAWNANPTLPGTIRQGFKQTTRSTSPYIASTLWDLAIVSKIYDSLHIVNPLKNSEDLSWMDISAFSETALTYLAPPGTVLTYRFTLMPNLNWQDGRPVTSFDVAFSYLSLLANGAFQGGSASSLSGVTILNPIQFDLNLKSVGPFTRLALTSLPIIPGRYWTCGTGPQPSAGTAPNIVPTQCPGTASANWDIGIAACASPGNTCYPTQYTLGTAPAQSACYPNAATPCAPPVVCSLTGCASFVPNLMNADAVKTGAIYDPIANHILIGSGAWTCGTGAGLGQACTPGNTQNPVVGQSYTLTRNGLGIQPGFSGDYFRSSGFLATWLWSGDINQGVNNFSAAIQCFGIGAAPLSAGAPSASSCAHWEQGIGANGTVTPVGFHAAPLKNDPFIKYVDVGGNNHWVAGDPVVYDADNDATYDTDVPGPGCPCPEPVIAGGKPANGTPLKFDASIRYFGGPTWAGGDAVIYDPNSLFAYDFYGAQPLIAGIACPGPPNTAPCGSAMDSTRVSIVKLYININWVYPDDWSVTPPDGIVALDPVLYAGSSGTLNPASSVGCASAYPTGGYDC